MDTLCFNVCSVIFGFCDPFDLFKLKMVSKKLHSLVNRHKLKFGRGGNLFEHCLDMWSQALFQRENAIANIEFLSTLFKLDENLVLAVGYIGDFDAMIEIYNLKYDILDTDIEGLMLIKVKQNPYETPLFEINKYPCKILSNPREDLEFVIHVDRLLELMNGFGDVVIINCMTNLPPLFQKATRPWKDQEDFSHNSEEFFWDMNDFTHERWFSVTYHNIHKCLEPDFSDIKMIAQ